MPGSNEVTTTLDRVLSPTEQLAIAAHLQTLRQMEDNLCTLAADWPINQRLALLRFVNHNRGVRFNIWAALDISTEVLA